MHLERMTMEQPDAMMMDVVATVRQVQRKKQLVRESTIMDIVFTNMESQIQKVTIMNYINVALATS